MQSARTDDAYGRDQSFFLHRGAFLPRAVLVGEIYCRSARGDSRAPQKVYILRMDRIVCK